MSGCGGMGQSVPTGRRRTPLSSVVPSLQGGVCLVTDDPRSLTETRKDGRRELEDDLLLDGCLVQIKKTDLDI